MNRFYRIIEISSQGNGEPPAEYKGNVLAGVSFLDQKGLEVKSSKQSYFEDELPTSPSSSLVCGSETNTPSGWMHVGGPIKGSYIIKNGEDPW